MRNQNVLFLTLFSSYRRQHGGFDRTQRPFPQKQKTRVYLRDLCLCWSTFNFLSDKVTRPPDCSCCHGASKSQCTCTVGTAERWPDFRHLIIPRCSRCRICCCGALIRARTTLTLTKTPLAVVVGMLFVGYTHPSRFLHHLVGP